MERQIRELKSLKIRRQLPVINLRQKDIAKEIGVSLSQFKRYENGLSDIPFAVAIRWADVLKVDMNEFKMLYIK